MSHKIEAVKPLGTWEGSNGTFYSIHVTLDDGTQGEVNATSPDRWKPGDEVEIKSKKETQYGCKLKLDKAGFNGGGYSGGGNTGSGDKQRAIEAQWALNASIQVNQALGKDNLDMHAIEEGAKALLDARDRIMKSRTA